MGRLPTALLMDGSGCSETGWESKVWCLAVTLGGFAGGAETARRKSGWIVGGGPAGGRMRLETHQVPGRADRDRWASWGSDGRRSRGRS